MEESKYESDYLPECRVISVVPIGVGQGRIDYDHTGIAFHGQTRQILFMDQFLAEKKKIFLPTIRIRLHACFGFKIMLFVIIY